MSYSPAEIYSLQVEQRVHDDLFHADISRLDLSRRIAHLNLHLSKYCGDLVLAEEAGNECAVMKALVDCAIISSSAATALNIDLSKVRVGDSAIPGTIPFLLALVVRVGRLAKATEALDHVEDYPFRRVWEQEFSSIFHMVISEIDNREGEAGANALSKIKRRLEFVRSKINFAVIAGEVS